jgi:hypothetical protein
MTPFWKENQLVSTPNQLFLKKTKKEELII